MERGRMETKKGKVICRKETICDGYWKGAKDRRGERMRKLGKGSRCDRQRKIDAGEGQISWERQKKTDLCLPSKLLSTFYAVMCCHLEDSTLVERTHTHTNKKSLDKDNTDPVYIKKTWVIDFFLHLLSSNTHKESKTYMVLVASSCRWVYVFIGQQF